MVESLCAKITLLFLSTKKASACFISIKEFTIMEIRSKDMSADITLFLFFPSFRIPETLITFSPAELTYGELTAILTLVKPSLYHTSS